MIAFYFIALLTIASALLVVLHRNPVYSALGLVNTLFLVAVSFVMLFAINGLQSWSSKRLGHV